MNLAQMRALAVDLAPAMVGESGLPRIAGGAHVGEQALTSPLPGSAWSIPIPFKEATVGVEGEKATALGPTLTTQLIGQGTEPTLMQSWKLFSIWCPVAFRIQLFEALASESEFETAYTSSIVASILYGGDLVWSQEKTGVINQPISKVVAFGSVTIADNFANPIEVRRGRTLTLTIALQVRRKGGLGKELELARLAQDATVVPKVVGGGAIESSAVQATIQYTAIPLSGHRQL
jgi:hypothetical protein